MHCSVTPEGRSDRFVSTFLKSFASRVLTVLPRRSAILGLRPGRGQVVDAGRLGEAGVAQGGVLLLCNIGRARSGSARMAFIALPLELRPEWRGAWRA